MSKPKVLILDGQSPAATECVLALAPRCELHLATCSGRSRFSIRHVTRVLHQPDLPGALGQWTEDLFHREGYQLVIPSTEISLHGLKSRDLDAALRRNTVIADEPSIDIALNKLRTVELAKSLGVPIPSTTLVTSPSELMPDVRYPRVIKPLYSKLPTRHEIWSFGARICRDAKDRIAACAELLPYTGVMEQEYFRGRSVGIEMLFEGGRVRWWFAHERIHELPITGGASTYRRSIAPPEALLHAADALLSCLHWHGVAMVEFKVAENGDFQLMEINPRLWGSLPLAVGAGVDFPSGLLCLARGEPLGEQPKYRRGLYMRHVARDLAWFTKSWKERRNPLRVSPLQWKDCLALLRPLTGSERWDFFRWRSPGVWWACMLSGFATLLQDQRRNKARKATDACWERLQMDWRTAGIRRVLVLCYGNICRSPVVERLLSAPGLEVKSAGFLSAGRVAPEDWARVVDNTLGFDLRDHRSGTVDAGQVEWADLILLMDAANWRALSKTFPDAVNKAVMLGSAAAGTSANAMEIRDPYELTEPAMRAVALTIKSHVDDLLRQRSVHATEPRAIAELG